MTVEIFNICSHQRPVFRIVNVCISARMAQTYRLEVVVLHR